MQKFYVTGRSIILWPYVKQSVFQKPLLQYIKDNLCESDVGWPEADIN